MSEAKQVSTGGVSFAGLLTVLFIGLKLTGVISWSWFWVLSPLIFTFLAVVLILLVVVVLLFISEMRKK